MDILLDAGANPSTADIHGAYPIHYAAQMCGPNSGNSLTHGNSEPNSGNKHNQYATPSKYVDWPM